MRFIYPAQLERYSQGEFVVSFRGRALVPHIRRGRGGGFVRS